MTTMAFAVDALAGARADDDAPAASVLERLAGAWVGGGRVTEHGPGVAAWQADTEESLVFEPFGGRGSFGQATPFGAMLFGLRYLHSVRVAESAQADEELLLESGLWVPLPGSGREGPTGVMRLASPMHETAVLARGVATAYDGCPRAEVQVENSTRTMFATYRIETIVGVHGSPIEKLHYSQRIRFADRGGERVSSANLYRSKA